MTAEETTLKQDLHKLGVTSGLFSAMAVFALVALFSSSVFVNLRVVQLAHGLQQSNDKIAAQQKVLTKQQTQLADQQKSIAAQQVELKTEEALNARRNCESLNLAYAAARLSVRDASGIQLRTAVSLYQRAKQAAAVNPPKNPQAQAARVISDRFLLSIVKDTVGSTLQAIADVDAKTKPLTCT